MVLKSASATSDICEMSVSANVQPPSDMCSSEQSLYHNSSTYLSTSSSFPISSTFPTSPIQCFCSFKPSYQGVTANISIRGLVVELWDWTRCFQKLTIRSCSSNDTVFCSRSVSSNVTTYIQLESNPRILFQSNSTNGHILLEIRSKKRNIKLSRINKYTNKLFYRYYRYYRYGFNTASYTNMLNASIRSLVIELVSK